MESCRRPRITCRSGNPRDRLVTRDTGNRKARLPGHLVRRMGVLYLRLKPGSSRESLARTLRAHLETMGVHYHVRTLKRQLSGSVATVPESVQEAMRDILLRDTDLQTATDIEFALWAAGLAVSPDRRCAKYVATERLLPLVQLWTTLNRSQSRRSLAVMLSRRLGHRGVRLKVDPLQVILAGRQSTARREILQELLALLGNHGIASEAEALVRWQRHADDVAGYAAARELEPVHRLSSLALAWKIHTRQPSMRQLAVKLKARLRARGLDLGVARIQVALAGKAKTVRAALVEEMESLLRAALPKGQDLSVAVAQLTADTVRLDDLAWVDARRISSLAKQWLVAHPESSMRQLAIRVAETARTLGYSTSSNTIQPILGGHKKKARGFVHRALQEQLFDRCKSVPAEHVLPLHSPETALPAPGVVEGDDAYFKRSATEPGSHGVAALPSSTPRRRRQDGGLCSDRPRLPLSGLGIERPV